MFEPKDPKKNRARSMSPQTYLEELPLDWYRFMVNISTFQSIGKRAASISNKWFKFDRYPEE